MKLHVVHVVLFEQIRKEEKEQELTLSLCSRRLTMTAVICWSRNTRMVARRAGRMASMASHHGSIDPGFTRNVSLYTRTPHGHNFFTRVRPRTH